MKYFFYSVVVVIIVGGIAFGIYYSIHTTELNKKYFIEDLTKSFEIKDLTYGQVLTLAERYSLSNSELLKTFNQVVSDIFTERDIRLKDKLKILETYRDYCKSDSPFEEFPEDINIHLNRIRDILKENSYAIEPLRIQLKILLEMKSDEIKKAKRIRNWSLGVGVVGVIIGVISIIIFLFGDKKRERKIE